MNPVYSSLFSFFIISFNIILTSTRKTFKRSLPFRYEYKHIYKYIYICLSHLSHSCFVTPQSHSPWSSRSNNVWCKVQSTKIIFVLFSSRYSSVGTDIFLGYPFARNLIRFKKETSFTPVHNFGWNFNFLCCDSDDFRRQKRDTSF
jgi:hypothetical protein